MNSGPEESRRRLPPPVLAKRKKKSAKTKPRPWYRHTAWMIPLAACGVFAVLIAGGLAVRQVVVVLRDNAPTEQNAAVTESAPSDSGPDDNAAGTPGAVETTGDSGPTASSEPGYEVLPPKAAKQPGRSLRKMLLVGPHPDMFPTLTVALEAAIPGDIVEIRATGPMLVTDAKLERETRANELIVIRAGEGFQPVLRSGAETMLEALNVNIILEGLHFASMHGGSFLQLTNADLTLRDCSMTCSRGTRAITVTNEDPAQDKIAVTYERCLLRGPSFSGDGANIIWQMRDTAFVVGSYGLVVGFQLSNHRGHLVRIDNSTVVGIRLIDTEPRTPDTAIRFQMHESIYTANWCCNPIFQFRDNDREFEALLQESIRELDARDNVAKYWSNWWAHSHDHWAKEPLFPGLPEHRQRVDFGEKLAQATNLIHAGSGDAAAPILLSLQPKDLAVQPTGKLAELMQQGHVYGADVRKLPTPPALTVEPYELPPKPES